MMNDIDPDISVEQAQVRELLERRATVQGWLDKLQGHVGSVSERVLGRVREDYEGRLQEVLNALASHRRLVQDELDQASARLGGAEQDHLQIQEELEEGRLRNSIGEIEDAEWADRSRALEADIRSARERLDGTRAEVVRLRDLLDQLDERTSDPVPPVLGIVPEEVEEAHLSFESATSSFETDADDIEDEDEEIVQGLVFDEYDPENATFLQQIDRALTDLPSNVLADDSEPAEDTAPRPGLKCSECGYTNDLSAWFCGVCGADVG